MPDETNPENLELDELAADDAAEDDGAEQDQGDAGADADLDDEGGAEARQPDGGAADAGEGDDAGQDARPQGQHGEIARDGRRPNRYQTLANRLRDSETRFAALQREIEEVRRAPNPDAQRRQQEEFERGLERARLDGPEAVIQFYRNQDQQQQQMQLRAIQTQLADSNDRQHFESLVQRRPALDRVRDEVERTVAAERAKGFNPSREAVAYYLIGKRAVERAQKAAPAQRARGAAQVARETVRPQSNRGGVPAGRERAGGEQAQRAKRLENLSI